jgi:uncharacterized protein YgiM (DUF1202 family)
MITKLRLTLVALLVSTAFPLLAGVDGLITASKLNIRVRPGQKYTQVAQVKKDEKVTVLCHKNGWYEVYAPPSSRVWVSSTFVEDGRVKKQVNLRAGPSVAFSSYRFAEPGEMLKVLDSSREGWLRVAPPAGLTAWVSAKYVYITPENAAKLAKKASTKKKPKKVVDSPKKNDPKMKNAKQDILPFLDSKGKIVTHEGQLVPLRKGNIYVTHAVAAKVNGEYFAFCYVHSDEYNLKLWENKKVNVTGVQRWVKGWQRPVVTVTKITPAH